MRSLHLFHILMALCSLNLLSMDIGDDYLQELKFHEKLLCQKLINKDMGAYYKKITPITSTPPNEFDRWICTAVSISGKHVYPDMGGICTDGDLSFKLDFLVDFNLSENLKLFVDHNKQQKSISFKKIDDKKIPIMPGLNSFKDLKKALSQNELSWKHKVTFKGFLCVPGENPCTILIELKNQCKQPITLRGMEIVYHEKKTKIFFDFVDQEYNSINFSKPIESKHSEVTADQKVICIKENKMFDCTGKKIYGFFDSPIIRSNWVEDEAGFFDLNRKKVVSLPSCYGDFDDHSEKPKDSVVWVFHEDVPSFYHLVDGSEKLENSNDYFYRKGGKFFLTLPYQATYKECFSQNNKVILNYLEQVDEPYYSIKKNVAIEDGYCNWKDGVYERSYIDNQSVWKKLGSIKKNSLIEFCSKDVQLDITFSTYPLDVQKTKQWCDAAQRFFKSFMANIHFCDQSILNSLSTWDKINVLNLTCLELDNGLKWDNLFKAIGSITQLTHLTFADNHPIKDFFSYDTHDKLADVATDYYSDFAVCIGKLKKLKFLYMPGLWLKPERNLGKGSITLPSMEVATITGMINHKQQKGIKDLLKSICALNFLEDLSIDSIPNNGSSDFCRKSNGQRIFFSPLWLITSPFQYNDGSSQGAALKQLVITSANQLANIPALKTITVYSPSGQYKDYFSKDFKAQLAVARNASLPSLQVIAKDLR